MHRFLQDYTEPGYFQYKKGDIRTLDRTFAKRLEENNIVERVNDNDCGCPEPAHRTISAPPPEDGTAKNGISPEWLEGPADQTEKKPKKKGKG